MDEFLSIPQYYLDTLENAIRISWEELFGYPGNIIRISWSVIAEFLLRCVLFLMMGAACCNARCLLRCVLFIVMRNAVVSFSSCVNSIITLV